MLTMKSTCPFVLFCCVFVLVVCHSYSSRENLMEYIEKSLQCHPKNPSLAVAVVKNKVVEFAEGFGLTNVERGIKATNKTLFPIASLSKAFAATLLMKQLNKANMDIFTNPAEILKYDFKFSDAQRSTYASIRDLLSHDMGIPEHNFIRFDLSLTRDTLPKRIQYLRATKRFRASFMYNNLLYGIITRISEILGGQSWEDLIKKELMLPLGMDASTFLTEIGSDDSNLAQGYQDITDGIIPVSFELNRKWGDLGGSGGVVSNAIDMAKWLLFHLDGGKNMAGEQIIDDNALRQIYIPQNAIMSSTMLKFFSQPNIPVSTSTDGYAFGWETGSYRGFRILRHTGTTWGFSSIITLFPDIELGIYSSMSGPDDHYIYRTLLHNYISDIYLGHSPWLNETTICSFPYPWIKEENNHENNNNKKESLHYDFDQTQYVGTYHNRAYGNLTINVNENGTLLMIYGIGKWSLAPKTEKSTFYGKGLGILDNIFDLYNVIFSLENNESTSAHQVMLPDFERIDPPVFKFVAI